MTEPVDMRERDLIRLGTGETLFVEAGAGTGKTTELVGRIAELVRQGTPVASIAAITFTEKAASELAERVRQRLEELAVSELAPEERARCAAAVRDLDQAAIQTLHSFAMRILSLYPLEAGLPPRITRRDDVEAAIVFRERWERFRDDLLDDPALEPVLFRAFTVGLRLKDLEAIASTLNQSWERLEAVDLPTAAEGPVDISPALDPWDEIAACRLPGADDGLTHKLDSLASFITTMREFRDASRRAPDAQARAALELDMLRLLSRIDPLNRSTTGRNPRGGLGLKENWDDVARMRDLAKGAEEARVALLGDVRTACICAILPRLRSFVLESAEERRRAGALEFHDLLVLSRNLLRDEPAVRRTMHQRYARILIDEFQDTDPLQVELAALLAMDPAGEFRSWHETAAVPGALFFVGDPKQSIYRFRRADIELYKQARGAFGARPVFLRQNFRCRPAIIEWVNQVCGALFSDFGAGSDARQADWIPLEAGRDPGKGGAVSLIGGAMDGDAATVRMEEADAIVGTVLKARGENWLGRDLPGRQTRFADIAILLPTRTNSPAIERALAEANIPVRVESRSLLFNAQEVADLTNILAAIDDPTDDVAVVASLRSPAFAVDDAELARHSLAGGRWDYLREPPEASPASVREAMDCLKALHGVRWQTGIGSLVEKVISERQLLELAVAGARPRETWRRLRFVSEQARALSGSGTVASLRQFVHWLRTQAKEGARIAEAVAEEPDDDAVRILTIHAAKGLEFPIVILAGLGVAPNDRAPGVAWGRVDGRETVAVRTGVKGTYFSTPGFEELRESEQQHRWLERDRLFYVAATRAKERLVVSLFQRAQKDHSTRHADRNCSVAACIEALRAEHPEWEELTFQLSMPVDAAAPEGPLDTLEGRETWRLERARMIEASRSAPVIAATTLAHADDGEAFQEPGEELPRDDDAGSDGAGPEDQPWKKGRGGTSIGRAVHAVLQTIDLATGSGIDAAAQAQAIAEGVAGEARHIAELVRSARESAPVREALALGRYWREVYVGCEVDGVVIEGFIDLLYESHDGLVIVDYKTDSVRSEGAIDRAMARYELQGASYALAVERALGRPVARCVFVFTEPRANRQVRDLAAAKVEVERRLAAIATPAGR